MAEQNERRGQRRKPRLGTGIQIYSLGSGRPVELSVNSVNISDNGTCIVSFHPFDEGEKLILNWQDNVDIPRSGEVKWCTDIEDYLYRIGINLS